MEPMPRSQDPFDHRLSPPADWQQASPPVPGAYPSGGQYPPDSPYLPSGDQYPPDSPYPPPGDQYRQDSPYPGEGKDEPGGRHRLTDPFQQPEPPQPWPEAPAGSMPVVGAPALSTGLDQYSQGDAYPSPYGNGQGQFPPGQFWPGVQGPGGQGLLGKLSFTSSPVAVAVAVLVGLILVVVGANALS